MKNKIPLLLLFLLVTSINSEEEVIDEDVMVLTNSNFNEAITKNKYILIEFYAPWCGHCKKLKPELAAAATELKNEGIVIAKCDATEEKEASGSYNITGYPTLFFFENGKLSDYKGERNKDAIVAWLRKKAGPPSKQLNSVSEVEEFASKTTDAVVVLIGNTGFASFNSFAKTFDEPDFGHCFSEDCVSHYKVKSGTVVVLKPFDEKRNDLAPGYNKAQFNNFINSKTIPLIMNLDNEKNSKAVFKRNVPPIFLWYDKSSSNADKDLATFKEVALQFKGRLQAVVTGITETEEKKNAENIGVNEEDLPTVRILDNRSSEVKKYNMEGDITKENIASFVEKWQKGQLKASLKSEPIPSIQEDFVQVLVANTYQEVVFDETKDVLVEFYAPWCGHCKQLAPLYEQLAEKLSHNQNLVIAKINAVANDIPKISITGYPTIKFWPADKNKTPIAFEGERTIEGFTEFLIKNSKNKVTEYNEDL